MLVIRIHLGQPLNDRGNKNPLFIFFYPASKTILALINVKTYRYNLVIDDSCQFEKERQIILGTLRLIFSSIFNGSLIHSTLLPSISEDSNGVTTYGIVEINLEPSDKILWEIERIIKDTIKNILLEKDIDVGVFLHPEEIIES